MTDDVLPTRGSVRSGSRLDRLFTEQAARTPSAIALIDDEGNMTFAELAAASTRMARALHTAGVRPGALVGVYLDRSRDYVTSMLGILKANCAVLPLPPAYPAERLREILAFADPAAIIDDRDAGIGSMFQCPVLRVADADGPAGMSDTAAAGDPDDPAFVLCSSGSTGKPKLIVRSHGSFLHRLHWTWRNHPYAPDEVCCMKSHTTTTHAIYELFEPLLQGAPVCIISDHTTRALESFWEAVRLHRVTRLLVVPSMLQASLDMPGFVAPDIRVLVLMGEYLSASLATRSVASFTAAHVYSIYGSTEASSTLVCDVKASLRPNYELPLGGPLSPDIGVHVLDEALNAIADDAPGMLYLSGPALFSGYLNDPALTAAALVTRDGERLYRSNDRVRRERDGTLHYLGRTDHVVKVRGFRVDLQEVETALMACAGVSQGVVIARGTGDAATLAAFVCPENLSSDAISRALREQLPDYMVPARVIGLAAMPRTPSGKIDRRQLSKQSATSSTAASRDAHTATERVLAQAWHAALGHPDFGPDSNFFEVGGSSLKTFAVIAQLRRELQLDRLQLLDDTIYRYPTFTALAIHLERACNRRLPDLGANSTPLVTLRSTHDQNFAPLFVIAAAGGTLGASARLVHALATQREVIGVRDPWLWGKRDAAAGFQNWIALYLDAIRARQPAGPYYLLAYSSAGAFGYEIARQLRNMGEQIALLALIDPLAMDRANRWRFGYWALQARFMRPEAARLMKLAGWLRQFAPRRRNTVTPASDDFRFTPPQLLEFEQRTRTNREHIQQISALLELDTGLPLALTGEELDRLSPEGYLEALLAKVHGVAPDVATTMIARMAVQYQLQVRSQHHYRLRWLDATLVLFEPASAHCGLLSAQLGACVRKLDARRVAMSPLVGHRRELAGCFPDALYPHYFCMRDDAFTQTVARQLDVLLGERDPVPPVAAQQEMQ